MKYCHISTCVNNKGTQGQIFRLPSDFEARTKWIDAIKSHHHANIETDIFNVCEKHFKDSDMYTRGSVKSLRPNSIPTIFCTVARTPTVAQTSTIQTKTNEELMNKIAELENEILRLKIENDVALQNEKIKANNIVKSQRVLLKNAKKELLRKEKQINKMSDLVDELQNERLVSPDDAKFLNVSSTIRHRLNYFG